MSKRGPKTTPTSLKILQGNPGKRAINQGEPKPKAADPGVPAAFKIDRFKPAHPNQDDEDFKAPTPAKEAAKIFKKLKNELKALGLLTEVDVEMLALYCQAFGTWREACAYVNRYGQVVQTKDGNMIQSPYLSIMNKQATMMHKLAAEFGFTPSSRTGLGGGKKDNDDPLAQLFAQRRKA